MKRRNSLFLVLSVAIAILAFLIILYTTAYSIGISPDSAVYISVARNLTRGEGLTTYEGKPLVAYPPAYPVFLAAMGLILGDTIQAARTLQALLFALNILLAGLILYRMSQRSLALALAGILILLPAFPLIIVHSHAWSEPLFLFFSLLSLWLLAEYIHHPKTEYIIGATLCISLAILTRYVGLALVPTAIIALWLPRVGIPVKKRIASSLVVLCSLVGIGLWLLRNTLTGEPAVNRKIIYHPILKESIQEGYHTLAGWFFIGQAERWVRIGIFTVIGLILLYLLIRRFRPLIASKTGMDISQIMIALIGIYWVCYILVVLITTTFIDITSILDYRILAPLYPTLIIVILLAVWYYLQTSPARWKYGLAVLGLLVFLSLQVTRHLSRIQEIHAVGVEYLGAAWTESPTIQYLAELPDGIPIYSNGPDLIYARSSRPARLLPKIIDQYSESANPEFLQEVDSLKNALDQGGVIIWVNRINWRYYITNINELSPHVCLTPIYNSQDGVVYQSCSQTAADKPDQTSPIFSGNHNQVYHPNILHRNVSRLPLGSVTVQEAGYPCYGSLDCYRLEVSCAQVAEPLLAEVRISEPENSPVKGTILVFSGGPGVEFYGDYTPENAPVLRKLVEAGYRVVEARWDEDRSNPWYKAASGVSEGHQNLSCRSATLAQWVHDRFTQEGTPYCALGHSNGATQLAYSLSSYGLGSIFKAAVLESGPNWSRLDQACLNDNPVYTNVLLPPARERIDERDNIDLAFGFSQNTGPCSQADASFRRQFLDSSLAWNNWRFYFPDTRLSFLFGELDPSKTGSQGRIYLNQLVKSGSPFVSSRTVRGAGHLLGQTPAGAAAIVDALLNTCVP